MIFYGGRSLLPCRQVFEQFAKRSIYKTPTIFLLDSEKRILAKSIPLEDVKGFVEFHEKQLAAKK